MFHTLFPLLKNRGMPNIFDEIAGRNLKRRDFMDKAFWTPILLNKGKLVTSLNADYTRLSKFAKDKATAQRLEQIEDWKGKKRSRSM